MTGSQVVRFPGYRDWEEKRVEASNAMMGLLAGAQLAAHLLKLTEGSNHLLPEVFPEVDHIGRLNLTTEEASRILGSADRHLGAMSVPYALALHEDYLAACLDLLRRAGLCSIGTVKHTPLAAQHGTIADLTGGAFDSDRLAQLDTLRRMRNCMIHDAPTDPNDGQDRPLRSPRFAPQAPIHSAPTPGYLSMDKTSCARTARTTATSVARSVQWSAAAMSICERSSPKNTRSPMGTATVRT